MGFVTVAEKLAQKGFRVAEHELALARRMDIAIREVTSTTEKLSSASRKTLMEGYQAFVKAAPEGTNSYDALRTFTKEVRDDFRRDYPTQASADAAFRKVQIAMSEEVRRAEGLESKAGRVEQAAAPTAARPAANGDGVRKPPTKPPETAVADTPPAPKGSKEETVAGPYSRLDDYDAHEARQIAREQREMAKAIRTAHFEADVNISKSASAMGAIADSRKGKMNVDAFFENLEKALSTKDVLKRNIGEVNQAVEEARQIKLAQIEQTADDIRKSTGDVAARTYRDAEILKLPMGRTESKSPQDIRKLIVDGNPVTIDEIAAARKYFMKYHNDSNITDAIPDTGKLAKFKGLTGFMNKETGPTRAQAYEYRTGERSLILSAESNPVRTGVQALLWTTVLSTGYTTIDYQHPTPLGSLIPGIIMDADDIIGQGDGIKGFSEYILYRYKHPISGQSQAIDDLKTYYGVDTLENLDQKGREDVVEKIRSNNLKRTDMTPDVQIALTLYVGERLFTKVTKNPDELQDALNEWTKKNNEAIDRKGDTAKSEADAKNKAIEDLKQAARTAGAPEGLLDGLGGANKGGAKSTSEIPPQTSTSYASTLTGDVFKQRLDGMKEEGLLSEDLHTKLASAFKSATKSPVSDAQEFTRANVANGREISAFARNASEILGQNPAIPKSAINQAVYDLLAPAP